jgi:hypothetical protein
MYTQLLKETIIKMQYDAKATAALVDFCRYQYDDSMKEKKLINEFEQDYDKKKAI